MLAELFISWKLKGTDFLRMKIQRGMVDLLKIRFTTTYGRKHQVLELLSKFTSSEISRNEMPAFNFICYCQCCVTNLSSGKTVHYKWYTGIAENGRANILKYSENASCWLFGWNMTETERWHVRHENWTCSPNRYFQKSFIGCSCVLHLTFCCANLKLANHEPTAILNQAKFSIFFF